MFGIGNTVHTIRLKALRITKPVVVTFRKDRTGQYYIYQGGILIGTATRIMLGNVDLMVLPELGPCAIGKICLQGGMGTDATACERRGLPAKVCYDAEHGFNVPNLTRRVKPVAGAVCVAFCQDTGITSAYTHEDSALRAMVQDLETPWHPRDAL